MNYYSAFKHTNKLTRNIAVIFFSAFFFIACNKKNDGCMPVSATSESEQLTAFCNSHSINYTVDTNGIYYQIIEQGSGASPNMNSMVTVAYTASTLDGNIIEDKTGAPVISTLAQFIECFRITLPYIQKGGHIKIVTPSSLAYGCTGIASKNIPPNSPLYYDIVLINVQ